MKTSSVMRFEDLLRLWQDSRTQTSILELLGIATCADASSSEKPDGAIENLCEKLRGTWWEVVWPTLSAQRSLYRGVQCRYLADSLQDAMRLRPNAGFPAHVTAGSAEDFTGEDEIDEPVEDLGALESATAWEF